MGISSKVYTQKTLRSRKFSFYLNAIILLGLVVFFLFIAGQNVYYETLRRNPNDELITATATSIQHHCSKGGCWYDSYGYYTIDGHKEQNVEVADHDTYSFMGTLSVIVDPNVPRFAMNPYYDPYPTQAKIFATFALGTFALNAFIFVARRRAMKKYAADSNVHS
ncbi:MAG: hypothetical protein JWM52_306 [Candidatus Saccharibacteria bacterium]|nr:hypothetical protein [Candidatus Saccharibacteria bacterium]